MIDTKELLARLSDMSMNRDDITSSDFGHVRAAIAELIALRDEIARLKLNHDWYCGCGHWNGSNLARCAGCDRTPAGSLEYREKH